MGRCKYLGGSSSAIILIKSLLNVLLLLLLLPSSFSNGFTSPYSLKQSQYKFKYDNLILSSCGNNNANFWEELWHMRYQELVAYNDEHGDTLVPQNYPDNLQLGNWVHTQRRNIKNNKLAQERVDKLNEIGFIWDPLENSWNEMLQHIVDYKEEHGDTLVPAKYPDKQQLGIWVDTQRQNRKNKKMSPERVNKLNDIGFVWVANGSAWEEMFHQLLEYEDKHGDTLVPQRYTDNPQLGIWVNNQRRNGKNNSLTQERIDKLNEIGFMWEPIEAAWEEMLQQLMKYKEEHGDTLVPAKYPENRQLGIWVLTQRQNRKNNSLASERVDKLNEIGFVWEPLEAAWQSKYNKLNTFYKRYGHTKIPMGGDGDEELYYWCMRQRHSKSTCSLPRHRNDQLKRINFDFFRQKRAKGTSLIENMIIYELERMGHEFDMLNKVFFGVRLFPDGVIIHSDIESVVFVEIDERYHSCRSSYPIKRELGRMNTLRKEAAAQGYTQVIFVRIGTGDQRKVVESQVEFVSKLLHELKSNVQPNRYSVHYIDYPDDHHHVIASREHFDEVKVFTSN
ncbi:helicase-associated domain-containing protein [Skeletonema marinoi]|uniref:Helicase-associated domain-containing protein n=1 Tax=Skeletonema marinoi TaxID=267567 RepID=A0AAD9D880_9STRA|nr:helicase-associated domain-containing protein [Skeletonema marinoi]